MIGTRPPLPEDDEIRTSAYIASLWQTAELNAEER